MTVHFPVYRHIQVDNYQMYPGTEGVGGISHPLTHGLHLVAGVNGLGKSTLLLMLYHGIVGPAAIRNDDFGVPQPETIPNRLADRFRRRVADAASTANLTLHFSIGSQHFEIVRSLHDLSIHRWTLDDVPQDTDETAYTTSLTRAMNLGTFSDVLIVLNLVVFMFEQRSLLMWTPDAQRNVLRALFMSPEAANILAERAQEVSRANSAYRNLRYIANRDRKRLDRARAKIFSADALSAELHTLQEAVAAQSELLESLYERRIELDEDRTEARATLERAKLTYDDLLRELEALKLARVANAFPSASDAARYLVARMLGDKECLACGVAGGPLVEKWIQTVEDGSCLVCGSPAEAQETIVPPSTLDTARIERAEHRLSNARQALNSATNEYETKMENFNELQKEIDEVTRDKHSSEQRIQQIAGTLPPSPPEIRALEEHVAGQSETLDDLQKRQKRAEYAFSEIFGDFQQSIGAHADQIRDIFGTRIQEFLLEHAEIALSTISEPIGESGRTYEWPSFELSMTSGTFDNPSSRRSRAEVSLSQGEFVDLAFRLSLVEVAADGGPATLVFDAPEASLDALFMRRAGAFLARFTQVNEENRLIVTSNLTNADMIPALFDAFHPEDGDPIPIKIPRSERRSRMIDLLKIAAPTTAIQRVGHRYDNLLDRALFPPGDQEGQNL